MMGKVYRLGTTKKKINNSSPPPAAMCGRSLRRIYATIFFFICICLVINLHYVINHHAVTSPIIPPRSRPYNNSFRRLSPHERTLQIDNTTTLKRPPVNETLVNVDKHTYPYLINEPDFCTRDGGYVRLIVVVPSGVGDFEQRNAIRETWGSYGRKKDFGVRVVFLVGSILNSQIQTQLQSESTQHHDLIQVSFHDSYRNLTIKSVALLKWVSTFCLNTRYVMKSDDDMYVDIPKLLQALDNVKEDRFFLCNIQYGARPIRVKKSKWYVLESEYSAKLYPNYCSGTAYSFSTSISAELFQMATKINMFWLEDIFISGILPRYVRLKQIHDPTFEYWKSSLAKPCHFKKLITAHRMSPRDLKRIWRMLKRPLRC